MVGLGFRSEKEEWALRGRDPDGDICQVPWALRGQAAKETQLGFPLSGFELTLNQKIGRQHIPQVRPQVQPFRWSVAGGAFLLLSPQPGSRPHVSLCDL